MLLLLLLAAPSRTALLLLLQDTSRACPHPEVRGSNTTMMKVEMLRSIVTVLQHTEAATPSSSTEMPPGNPPMITSTHLDIRGRRLCETWATHAT